MRDLEKRLRRLEAKTGGWKAVSDEELERAIELLTCQVDGGKLSDREAKILKSIIGKIHEHIDIGLTRMSPELSSL